MVLTYFVYVGEDSDEKRTKKGFLSVMRCSASEIRSVIKGANVTFRGVRHERYGRV